MQLPQPREDMRKEHEGGIQNGSSEITGHIIHYSQTISKEALHVYASEPKPS